MQQQLHSLAAGVPQGSARPAVGPVPRQTYNQAGAGMYAAYQGQHTPSLQGQPPGVRPGRPAAPQTPQQVTNSLNSLYLLEVLASATIP